MMDVVDASASAIEDMVVGVVDQPQPLTTTTTSTASCSPRLIMINHATHLLSQEALLDNLTRTLACETAFMPADRFLSTIQADYPLASTWRKQICHWIREAAIEFDMSFDTIAYAINYMDRFLSYHPMDKLSFQLMAMVALTVASKMHERHPITMAEMQCLCQQKFPPRQILKMEQVLLQDIGWTLNPPTCMSTMHRLVALLCPQHLTTILRPLHDLLFETLTDPYYLGFRPSSVALAAFTLVCPTVDVSLLTTVWPEWTTLPILQSALMQQHPRYYCDAMASTITLTGPPGSFTTTNPTALKPRVPLTTLDIPLCQASNPNATKRVSMVSPTSMEEMVATEVMKPTLTLEQGAVMTKGLEISRPSTEATLTDPS